MKIGIYLGYGPNTILYKEGLGRYLAVLIKGLVEKQQEVAVALPKWLMSSFCDLAEEFEIDIRKIDFIVEYRTPVAWLIFERISRKKKRDKEGFRIKVLYSTLKFGEFCLNILFSVTNMFLLLLLVALGVIVGVALCPFGLVGGVLYFVLSVCKRLFKREKIRGKELTGKMEEFISKTKGVGISFSSKIFQNMTEKVQKRLVEKINREQRKVDIWYSPSIFWPSFNDIIGKKVVNVPDLVVMDYPLHWYGRYGVISSSLRGEETIEGGMAFVTYSDFIKRDLLIRRYGKRDEDIRVIPHMVNDMAHYVTIDAKIAAKNADPAIFTKALCRTLLKQACFHVVNMQEYVRTFDFENVKYMFYSSQARPHKNLLNLLKAYKYILRTCHKTEKLFVTGNLYEDAETRSYILENKLQYDVLCFYNLPAQLLAALYHEAELIVNPTLYEGGFPFTFSEGMSVGVPSIMSDIPQIREVVGERVNDCLFDPYDTIDIAEKMKWGLEHKEEMLKLQEPIYEEQLRRTKDKYVGDYVEAFRFFAG